MSLLDKVVAVVPVATKAALSAEERNVLRHPDPAVTPAVRHDALTHDTAGPVLVTTPRERVAVFLGPGATFEGIADTLAPLYAAAAAGGGPKAPTRDELARALVVYNKAHLPAGDWRNHKVGMRLLLPVEVDPANGEWIVDADKVRAWAKPASFPPAWRAQLRTPPAALAVPDPFVLEGDAIATVVALAPRDRPTIERLGLDLRERALRNPFESVLLTVAVLRALDELTPRRAAEVTLAAVDGTTAHQASELASTHAGNGLLRRFSAVLAATPPPGTDPARLARARALLDSALFQGPPTARTLVAHRELPQTPGQLRPRTGVAKPTIGAATDPPGGLHRLVLGRDLAVGRSDPEQVRGVTFTGPAFSGRVALKPYLAGAASRLNPSGDPKADILLAVLAAEAPDLGQLDGVRARGPGMLAAGLDRWPAATADQLPALLAGFKDVAPDEFDLFFALHGLDVDANPANANEFRLREISRDGSSTIMKPAELRTFLGGTVGAGGAATFAPEWAARFRLPALVSLAWRRTQAVWTVDRLQRLITPRLLAKAFGPFPTAKYEIALDRTTALSSAVTAAIGKPADPPSGVLGRAKAAGAPSAETLAGAVIDLTGAPTTPAYAGFEDDEMFNLGSMAKAAPMYAAYELRHRVQKLVGAAKHFGLDPSLPTWWTPIVDAIRQVWPRTVAQGFPGLDTRFPERFPDLDAIFKFEPDGTVVFRTRATAEEIRTVGSTDSAVPAHMEFFDWMTLMVLWSHNEAASKVIDALRYPYLNGALREGGFFDPKSRRGIWVSGNYAGNDWTTFDFLPLSDRGRKHYQAKTNFAGTAEQFARMLALAARGRLFDRNTALCNQMLELMRKRTSSTDPLPSGTAAFIAEAVRAIPHPVDKVSSKIGVGVISPDVPGRKGFHDCAVLERRKGTTVLRYVAVVIGGYNIEPDRAAYKDFIQALDKCIADAHP